VTVVLHQPLGDLYGDLGVAHDASRDEIAAAYRARAKELHPDTRPLDTDAADRFARVGAAYRILSDPERRARYDASWSAAAPAPELPAPAPRPGPPPVAGGRAPIPPRSPSRPRLGRKGAHWCAWGGIALMVLGAVVTAFVVSLQRHDADLRAHGVAATATVVDVGSDRKLEFRTRDGRVVRTSESVTTGEEQPPVGSQVRIHYDRSDPSSIVADESHTGRNVTLWIVAVKLVVGGAVLCGFGVRALRRARWAV
jgi:hypothetical protein